MGWTQAAGHVGANSASPGDFLIRPRTPLPVVQKGQDGAPFILVGPAHAVSRIGPADDAQNAAAEIKWQQLAAIPDDTFDATVDAHKDASEPITTAGVAHRAIVGFHVPRANRSSSLARARGHLCIRRVQWSEPLQFGAVPLDHRAIVAQWSDRRSRPGASPHQRGAMIRTRSPFATDPDTLARGERLSRVPLWVHENPRPPRAGRPITISRGA